MGYKIEFDDGDVRVWKRTADGARCERVSGYHPTCYVAGGTADERAALELHLAANSRVADIGVERWHLDLHSSERTPVLRVDVATAEDVRAVAHDVRAMGDPGQFRWFDVDFSPGFRYCLETDTDPTPGSDLSTLRLDLPEAALHDGDISAVAVDGESVGSTAHDALVGVDERVRVADPNVLVVGHGDVVPLLFERADELGVDFRLGRLPGYDQLAGENTFHSYGRVGHSPARYDVPGRAILDAGHGFFWSRTSLRGMVDLVEFSHKPLQEIGWASIGNVLTAIEIREARKRGVLAPWNKWEPETFKRVETLHEADRGGFIFDPDVGFHEDVREVDFSSLYPNVIRHMNVSPETVDCECCPDRVDVPGLGYTICDERGFLPDVLAPLLDHRRRLKWAAAEVAERGDDEAAREARLRADALKWILVACFGYQGYRNAKFGRIECHEAINAFARAAILTAKERFEAAGWHVVHGIVDSLWLTSTRDDPDPIQGVCDDLGAEIDVPLEFENRYDWLALVPRRGQESGALTKYFGKVADAETYKVRGIELRQRSTPAFVADAQRAFLETLDARRDPAAVCDALQRQVGDLHAGAVDPADLAIAQRVSKRLEAYAHETRTVAALRRARDLDVEYLPGETVRYVVVNDAASAANRVRLAFEEPGRYDADFYADLLARAAESVVSPLGWTRSDIDAYLERGEDVGLGAFVSE